MLLQNSLKNLNSLSYKKPRVLNYACIYLIIIIYLSIIIIFYKFIIL